MVAAPAELLGVDRRGRAVQLKKSDLGDFWFEPVETGEAEIARFWYQPGKGSSANWTKCGYYRTGGRRIVVPPLYDQCSSFDKGSALVCLGCRNHCEGGDCHVDEFIGGEGLVLNEQNQVQKRFALPTIPKCSASNRNPEEKSTNATACTKVSDPFSDFK